MVEMRNAYRILVGKLSTKGRILLKWMLGKYGKKMWTGFIWFRMGTIGGTLLTR
jgi:hypothetical protein